MFNVVMGYLADQSYRGPWEKQKSITQKNTNLYSLTVTNKGADCWIQLHDHASAASETSNYESYSLPANSTLTITSRRYVNGLYVRGVTAADGAVVIGSDDLKFHADYMIGPLS